MGEREEDIRSGMLKLIQESCDFEKYPNDEFQRFHKHFLKFSFGALDIDLNYECKCISVWNSKPLVDAVALKNLNESLLQKVNYENLEDTLMGCVEMSDFSERFYKHILFEFDRLDSDDEIKIA